MRHASRNIVLVWTHCLQLTNTHTCNDVCNYAARKMKKCALSTETPGLEGVRFLFSTNDSCTMWEHLADTGPSTQRCELIGLRAETFAYCSSERGALDVHIFNWDLFSHSLARVQVAWCNTGRSRRPAKSAQNESLMNNKLF